MKLRIKELREEYQFTQKELAEKLGNVQRNVSNWENGTSEPDCETILKLADIFKVSIDELFGRNETAQGVLPMAEDAAILMLIRRLDEQQAEALKNFLATIRK